ncbi:O-antigen ligase family protein [Paraburkholderia sp. BR10954]|uniref:O-antigen ligase family protein n=1 Tax=Paraburkholderia sp. BR10954 TaxID=3236995 RepID=UPI0034D27969
MVFPPSLLWFVSALLFFAPALNLVWRGGTGYCFFVLLALALCITVRFHRADGFFSPLHRYRWYTVGMVTALIAIIVQQPLLGYWMPREFDSISRFALALPVFLLLRQLPSRNLRAIGWGCAVGAIVVGGWALIMRSQGGWTDNSRLDNYYTNAIPFGDTALLLAFLSIFTLGWDGPRNWRMLIVKMSAFLCGGYASYLSGTRGGWLAIPVFVVLLGAQYQWFANRKSLLVSTIMIVVVAGALWSNERVAHRIKDIATDYVLMHQGKDHTSVGIRIQLWLASYRLFMEHPVYGVGKGHLEGALGELAQRGIADAGIVNERAHSDFFSTLAEQGSIGVLSLMLFYFGLSVYFWRSRRAADATIRAAAYSGLAVSFSTIIFGLTIDVLVPTMVAVLIALLSATFLAVIDARKRELTIDSGDGAPSGWTRI